MILAHRRSTIAEPGWIVAAVVLSAPGVAGGVGGVLAQAHFMGLDLPPALDFVVLLGAVATYLGVAVSPFSSLAALLVVTIGSLVTRSSPRRHLAAWVITLVGLVGAAIAVLSAGAVM
jgi:hypothetical protein